MIMKINAYKGQDRPSLFHVVSICSNLSGMSTRQTLPFSWHSGTTLQRDGRDGQKLWNIVFMFPYFIIYHHFSIIYHHLSIFFIILPRYGKCDAQTTRTTNISKPPWPPKRTGCSCSCSAPPRPQHATIYRDMRMYAMCKTGTGMNRMHFKFQRELNRTSNNKGNFWV